MKKLFLPIVIALVFISSACEADTIERLSIVSKMCINYFESLCQGAFSARKCLNFQIGDKIGSDEWKTDAIAIEGFSFEHGYISDLKVEITSLDTSNCADECPTYSYKLIEVISTLAVDDFCLIPPNPDVACTEEYAPVCGCNKVTYSNDCYAESSGVASWTLGECN